jgi:hypothetical protein
VNERQIDIYMQSYHDAPLQSAYINMDNVAYAFGDFARSNQIRQYHEFSKWDELSKRILVILGLVKSLAGLPSSFNAKVGLLLPRAEVTVGDRTERIEAIKQQAANGFLFRNDSEPTYCDLEISLFTEGTGIFTNHNTALGVQGISSKSVDIPVLMGGERNTSVLLFQNGKMNPELSDSNGPQFFRFVEDKVRKTMGVDVPLSQVIEAIARKETVFRYPGLKINIAQSTEQALEEYFQAQVRHLSTRLENQRNLNVCGAGGALWLIWDRLQPWFEQNLNIPATYLGDGVQATLQSIFAESREFDIRRNPADPWRFADALGIYRYLLNKYRQEETAPINKVGV